jgi:hypothetical protein
VSHFSGREALHELAPKPGLRATRSLGRSGRKFELILSETAKGGLGRKLAEKAAAVTGAPVEVELVSTRVVVELDLSGERATLKIKARGVVPGTGAVVKYKAKLTGALAREEAL